MSTLLTPAELAGMLNVKESTLAQWRYLRRGPAFLKLSGGLIRYRQKTVAMWLDQQTHDHAAAA